MHHVRNGSDNPNADHANLEGPAAELSALADEELMRLSAEGNGDAFDTLYHRYEKALHGFINRFLGDRQATEDMVQETFLRVFKAAPDYEARCKFSTWLYRIATNLCLNELRYRKSHRVVSLNATLSFAVTDSETEDVELQDLLPDPSAENPHKLLESKETLDEIERALSELPDGQRQVISLYVYRDMKLSEVADELHCSIGTVKSRAHYGLKSVRERLNGEADTDEQSARG